MYALIRDNLVSKQSAVQRSQTMRTDISKRDLPQGQQQKLPLGMVDVKDLDLRVGRVFLYQRVSSERQTTGAGLDRQSDDALAWCEQYGLIPDDQFKLSDGGFSASKGHHVSKGSFGRFLQAAQRSELGVAPLLVIENIDRISRLEPLDGLYDVVLALLRNGVSIAVVDKGGRSETIYRGKGQDKTTDTMHIMRLVIELEKAHKYSKDLSDRVADSWERFDKALLEGRNLRPRHIMPRWLRWNDDDCRYEPIEDRVATIQRLFDLFEDFGSRKVAAILNSEGHKSWGRWENQKQGQTGGLWNTGTVRTVLMDNRVWGAYEIHPPDATGRVIRQDPLQTEPQRFYYARRSLGSSCATENTGNGTKVGEAQYTLVENVFPAIIERDRVERLRLRSSARGSDVRKQTRCNEKCWWIGSRITQCVCGQTVQLCNATCNPSPKANRPQAASPLEIVHDRDARGRKIIRRRYMKCSNHNGQCDRGALPLRALTCHVLARLTPSALSTFLASDARSNDATELEHLLGENRKKREDAKAKVDCFTKNMLQMMRETNFSSEIFTGELEELHKEVAAWDEVIAGMQSKLASLHAPVHLTETNEALQELRLALAQDTADAEQRRRVNAALIDLDLQIHVDGAEAGRDNRAQRRAAMRVGLQFGNGPINWQPLNADASYAAIKDGRVDRTLENFDGFEIAQGA